MRKPRLLIVMAASVLVLASGLAQAQDICPRFNPGTCDEPALRDQFIPDGSSPVLRLRTLIHGFCENDGTGCLLTESVIDAQMTAVNTAFAQIGVQFSHQTVFHNDSRFTDAAGPPPNVNVKMYAVDEQHQLNIFHPATGGRASDFPWEGIGRVMLRADVIGQDAQGQDLHWLTHEIGHALGLWHTFIGTESGDDCEPGWYFHSCIEHINATDRDFTGDFCSDTPPTTGERKCLLSPAVDCAGDPLPLWDPNFMSYSAENSVDEECRTEFSGQQAGRVRCWANAELICWIDTTIGDVDCSGTVTSADVIHLVNYSRGTGPPPCPLPNAGDFNCDAIVDLDDANLLINYIFGGGPQPECCTYD